MSARHLIRVSILLAAFAAFADESSAQTLGPRQVAAPPEDILSGRVRLPEPSSVRTLSRVAALPIELAPDANGRVFETPLPIDSLVETGDASFAILGRDTSRWSLSVTRPDGRRLDLARGVQSGAILRRTGALAGSLHGLTGTRYDVADAERGTWTVRIETSELRPASGLLVVRGGGELHLASHLTTNDRRSDRRIGVAAYVLDGPSESTPRVGRVADARLRVDSPVGLWTLAMFDDGRHADGAPADGVFGAYLPLGISGEIAADVRVEGVTEDGQPFLRTTRSTLR